ncbi:restriction endonuclease subunit S [Vibrio cincinnatiensis]
MVPNGWTAKTLNELCKMQAGKFVKAADIHSEFTPNLYPCFGGNGLRGFTKSFTHEGEYSLIGRQGALCGNITLAKGKFHATEHAVVTFPKKGIDTKWLYYILNDLNLNQYATGQAQPGLSVKNLESVLTVAPDSLPEQRKIAQILSTWDKAITTTEKLIDASKQQKKALMQQLLTGKKRLVDPETGKAFEGEWEEVKLGDLGKTFTGLTGKTKEHFGRGSKYIPYINIFRNSSVDMNALELVDVRPNEKQNLVKYGDIFFTTSSETPEEVGMSSVILEEIDESVYLNSFCFGFRPHNFNRVKPEFIRYLLRSEKVRRSISLLAQGATRYNLSKTQLLKITLNIPSLGEQQKIASVLTAADKDIELLEAKLAHFKQEKKALMQQLLTGKRRVKVAETEAA